MRDEYLAQSLQKLIELRGDRYKKAIMTNNLTPSDAVLIDQYTSRMATNLNGELRARSKDAEILRTELELNNALDKLSPYNNKTLHVDFDICDESEQEEVFNWFEARIGKIVQFPNFLGTSTEKWKDRCTYLKINTSSINSRSRDISFLSGKQKEEKEVLYKSKSNFTILKIDRSQKTIYLEEVGFNLIPNYVLYDLYFLNETDQCMVYLLNLLNVSKIQNE